MNTGGSKRNSGCHLLLQVFFAVAIGVVLSVFSGNGLAVAEVVIHPRGEWEYILDGDGNAALTDYHGNETEIVLPDTIDGYTVTGLKGTFYENKDLRKIVMPDTVTYIERTFTGCSSLSEIIWSKNLVNIGDSTFSGCSALSKITLPDSVSHIGDWAFSECCSMKIDHLPADLVAIGDYAFRDCTALMEITFSDSLETIGNHAFDDCASLYSVKFPDTLRSIGEKAFVSCFSLASVKLPSGLQEMDSTAFSNCNNLADIQLDDRNPYFQSDGGIIYNADKTEVIMAGSRTMRLAKISEGVKKIHADAFYECGSIKQITLPDSLEYIGDRAFYQIGIRSITIPKNVTEIGKWILYNCGDLQQVEVLGPIEDLNRICDSCYSLTQVYLSEGIRIISGFSGCSSLQQISLPESTEVIDEWAFDGSGIVSLSIPAGVVRIEEGTLARTNLETVTIAEGNTHFYARQEGLYNEEHTLLAAVAVSETVSISEGCARIGDRVFWRQSTLSRVEIPDTVMEIGEEAFLECQNLTEISVGNQLRKIGSSAFRDTPFLAEKKELEDGVYYLGSYAISCTWREEVLKLREGCTVIADSFSAGNRILKYLWLPDSLQYIGNDAFWYNEFLQEIIGGRSLKYIGRDAFLGNRELERILIRGEKVTIETDAFDFTSMHLSELMIDAEEVVLAENCFGGGKAWDINGISISTLILPNLNIPLRKTGLSYISNYQTKLLLTNMSAEMLRQNEALFADCEGLRLYLSESKEECALGDSLSEQGVSVFYREEWHFCRFMVYGAMKQLSIMADGETVVPPAMDGEEYFVTSEGPLLSDIQWDLDGDGIADKLPETIHEDIWAESLYHVREEKHNWQVKEVLQEQNCTQSGDVIYHCGGCGKEKQIQTEALGHDFSTGWTVDQEASCTEMGEKSHHCTREGCTERKDVTPVIALGHIWDAGIITVEPQIGVEGEKTFTCTVCGEQKQEVAAPIPEQTATPEPSLPEVSPGEPAEPTGSLASTEPVNPEESERPEESMKPGGSDYPKESEKPGDSTDPEESGKPGGSESPEETIKPESSENPEETIKPENSEDLEGSEKPGGSENPEGSEKPGGSESPEGSEKPNNSGNPEESRMPDQPRQPEEPELPMDTPHPMTVPAPDANLPAASDASAAPMISDNTGLASQITISGFRAKSNYSQITLYWMNDHANANVWYWIYRAEKKNGRKKLLKKLSGNQASYSDKQVAAGKTYYYQINVMQWNGNEVQPCGNSSLCKAALKVRKAPSVQIAKKHRGKIRYLEITLKNYTGKRLEIFYRKRKMGAYRRLNLRSNYISKYKKFRIRYLSNDGNIFLRFRTYKKQGKIKIYSRYTAEKKISVTEKNT